MRINEPTREDVIAQVRGGLAQQQRRMLRVKDFAAIRQSTREVGEESWVLPASEWYLLIDIVEPDGIELQDVRVIVKRPQKEFVVAITD